MTARHRTIRLESAMDGTINVLNLNIGASDQVRFYKSFAEDALERIIGDRMSYPSPYHDRINRAHARMCAFYTAVGYMPSKSVVLNAMQEDGHSAEAISDVLTTIDAHDTRAPVSDGKIALHLEQVGLPVTKRLIDQTRIVAVAAMAKACLEATKRFHAPFDLPETDIMKYMDLEAARLDMPAGAVNVSPVSAAQPTENVQPISSTMLDDVFSVVATKVIEAKINEGKWDQKRGKEIQASVNLFIEANGDIRFSEVAQHHVAAMSDLMTKLPKRYNHFMVDGQGGFAAALKSVVPPTNPDDETDEERALRKQRTGLAGVTRNKHFTWFNAVVFGAAGQGYKVLSVSCKDLRQSRKQLKRSDPRKPHERRPNWDRPTYIELTSGPVHAGCIGINDRFHPGNEVIHDGAYFGPLLGLNLSARPSEEAGLAVADVYDDAPIPYIHVRHNALRRLKNNESERMVPVHPKLIELGFLEYVRLMRSNGHEALFPEWNHPENAMDFAKIMFKGFFGPARKHLFPNGSGLAKFGKETDAHSLRGTGRTALRDYGVQDSLRNYISGHADESIGVDVYETPAGQEQLLGAIKAFDGFFAHLKAHPFNPRPLDRQRFGSVRGRPPKSHPVR
ncbi:MAG: hypothetical protein ACK519_11175 [Sphingomonadaceae bacterium]|jgi:hypothetical protein